MLVCGVIYLDLLCCYCTRVLNLLRRRSGIVFGPSSAMAPYGTRYSRYPGTGTRVPGTSPGTHETDICRELQ